MVSNLYDDNVALPTVSHDRVEEPPERRQVLHIQVFESVFLPQGKRNAILLHDLAMKAVREEDRTEGAENIGSPPNSCVKSTAENCYPGSKRSEY